MSEVATRFEREELLGEGGMSEVYAARQVEPLERDVALKFLKAPLDDLEAQRRFNDEAEALGRLAHGAIATLYEAGIDEQQRPYLALERVRGRDIATFAKEERLTVGQRLRLLTAVADAMSHAHARGVLHRDLKASNILIDEQRRDRPPKVIDFGIAQRLDRATSERTSTALLGTLLYMSPEQVRGERIDPRTDIYGLGMVAYELLSGLLPYEESTPSFVVARLIQQQRLPSMAERLASSGSSTALQAEACRTTPAALRSLLSGDVGQVVQKATASDPEQRYQSMAAFADDLRALLERRPISAREPSLRYRALRFLQRNRLASGFAGVALLSLVVATVVSVGALRQAQEDQLRAETEASRAQASLEFLLGLFASANPDGAEGASYTVRGLLDQAVADISGEGAEDAAAFRTLLPGISRAYLSLGDAAQALSLTGDYLATAPPEELEFRRSAQRVQAAAHAELGNFEAALAALEAAEQLRGAAAPEDDPAAFELAEDRLLRAGIRYAMDDFDGAFSAAKEAEAVLDNRCDVPRQVCAELMQTLSVLSVEYGRLEESLALGTRAAAQLAGLYGEQSVSHAVQLQNLAIIQRRLNNLSEADALYGQVLAVFEGIYDAPHPNQANTLNNRSLVAAQLGDFIRAESLARESLSTYRTLYGESHTKIAVVLNNLGRFLGEQERWTEAIAAQRAALAMQLEKLGEASVGVASIRLALADSLLAINAVEEARRLLELADTGFTAKLGSGYPAAKLLEALRGEIALRRGDFSAIETLKEGFDRVQQSSRRSSVRQRRWEQLLAAHRAAAAGPALPQ